MDPHQHCLRRLRSTLRLAEQAESLDFPYTFAKSAVHELTELLRDRLAGITALDVSLNYTVRKTLYKESLGMIAIALTYLGFLVRSTDVRNAFELYEPIAELVTGLVDETVTDPKLVLSSEWDYSPFTYNHPSILGMDDYVFIGMPASETGNALVTPLAGHEIGHNVWRTRKLASHFEPMITKKTLAVIGHELWGEFERIYPELTTPTDLFSVHGLRIWKTPISWAMRQLEELFCDFIGIRYFGDSFLHAYAYLVTPAIPGQRSVLYPSHTERIEAHERAARRFNLPIPIDYASFFEEADNPPNTGLFLKVTKRVIEDHLEELLNKVDEIVVNSGLELYDQTRVEAIVERFKLAVPANEQESLANIIGAGWRFYLSDFETWDTQYPDLFGNENDRESMLSDLLFKSMEVSHVKGAYN